MRFQLRAGFVIPAVLLSGVNSEVPGTTIAQVAQDVYDNATGSDLLIPQGARLIVLITKFPDRGKAANVYHRGSWWPPISLSFERCSRWISCCCFFFCSASWEVDVQKPTPTTTHRIPAPKPTILNRVSRMAYHCGSW